MSDLIDRPGKTGKVGKDMNVPSNDCISRQAAIDAFWKLDIELRPSAIDAITDMFRTLPSAQPRRLRGRWVETERRGILAGAKYYKCNICAQAIVVVDSTPMAYGYNYCPRCGSQMEEGQDG